MLSFLSKQEKGWVGIDIGSSSVKMVALSKRGNSLKLDSYAVVPLPSTAVIEVVFRMPLRFLKQLNVVLNFAEAV